MTITRLTLAAGAALLLMPLPASARTCEQIAAACVKVAIKGGHDKNEWRRICFEPKRMAECKRTGKYYAPSGGRIWHADK